MNNDETYSADQEIGVREDRLRLKRLYEELASGRWHLLEAIQPRAWSERHIDEYDPKLAEDLLKTGQETSNILTIGYTDERGVRNFWTANTGQNALPPAIQFALKLGENPAGKDDISIRIVVQDEGTIQRLDNPWEIWKIPDAGTMLVDAIEALEGDIHVRERDFRTNPKYPYGRVQNAHEAIKKIAAKLSGRYEVNDGEKPVETFPELPAKAIKNILAGYPEDILFETSKHSKYRVERIWLGPGPNPAPEGMWGAIGQLHFQRDHSAPPLSTAEQIAVWYSTATGQPQYLFYEIHLETEEAGKSRSKGRATWKQVRGLALQWLRRKYPEVGRPETEEDTELKAFGEMLRNKIRTKREEITKRQIRALWERTPWAILPSVRFGEWEPIQAELITLIWADGSHTRLECAEPSKGMKVGATSEQIARLIEERGKTPQKIRYDAYSRGNPINTTPWHFAGEIPYVHLIE